MCFVGCSQTLKLAIGKMPRTASRARVVGCTWLKLRDLRVLIRVSGHQCEAGAGFYFRNVVRQSLKEMVPVGVQFAIVPECVMG